MVSLSTRKVLARIYNFLTRTTNLEITRKPEKTVSVIKFVFDKKVDGQCDFLVTVKSTETVFYIFFLSNKRYSRD